MTISQLYGIMIIVNKREVRIVLGWNEYCKIHHISKKDKREIENLIQWRKNYLNYLKKEKEKRLTNS